MDDLPQRMQAIVILMSGSAVDCEQIDQQRLFALWQFEQQHRALLMHAGPVVLDNGAHGLMRAIAAKHLRFTMARRGSLFIAQILTAFIDNHRIVGNRLFGIAVILRNIAPTKFRFDVDPAGKAVVLEDFHTAG
ncbi:Uncharacterised protein [Kluyvera cryocrescens]|uniref:Uncharacterized protein n=1 Tax=Kluyvera cryocrescens TaxID=580 RepID=A0A485CF28_KLUCR|nr:Uncharacterised protein [Kluyvera cryocrescens]